MVGKLIHPSLGQAHTNTLNFAGHSYTIFIVKEGVVKDMLTVVLNVRAVYEGPYLLNTPI